MQSGCAGSTGVGATLDTAGSIRVTADDLQLLGGGLPPGQPALLYVATGAANGGAGTLLGDRLRCAAGGEVRLGVRASTPAGPVSFGPGLSATGGWRAGDTRSFQVWYRDPAGPCGSGANLSAGLAVRFGS